MHDIHTLNALLVQLTRAHNIAARCGSKSKSGLAMAIGSIQKEIAKEAV